MSDAAVSPLPSDWTIIDAGNVDELERSMRAKIEEQRAESNAWFDQNIAEQKATFAMLRRRFSSGYGGYLQSD